MRVQARGDRAAPGMARNTAAPQAPRVGPHAARRALRYPFQEIRVLLQFYEANPFRTPPACCYEDERKFLIAFKFHYVKVFQSPRGTHRHHSVCRFGAG